MVVSVFQIKADYTVLAALGGHLWILRARTTICFGFVFQKFSEGWKQVYHCCHFPFCHACCRLDYGKKTTRPSQPNHLHSFDSKLQIWRSAFNYFSISSCRCMSSVAFLYIFYTDMLHPCLVIVCTFDII